MATSISYIVISQRDYQIERLMSFVTDPALDPQGVGFHISQLLIALGSGGPLGLGWSESRQKFFYVPGAHTDGVFAILGEELGFIGLMFVLGLFAVFLFRALRVTLRTADQFGMLLGIGIIAWISYQTLINIGGITRTIPLTGVPLPFLSYGGSSLITTMAAVGILLSVSRYARAPSRKQKPSQPAPKDGHKNSRRGRRKRGYEGQPA